MRHIILAAVIAVCVAGCASGYSQFYTANPTISPKEIESMRAAPPPASPIVERAGSMDPESLVPAYNQRGYVPIGHSSFSSGGRVKDDQAIEHGKKVGADLVLIISPHYAGSVTSAIPIVTPTSQTSRTSSTATAYGAGGTVNAYGNSTTTTYGTKTNFIPYTVHRMDYGAVYFVKQRFSFGGFVRPLNNTERQQLQTNQGLVITTVVDDTPAYRADILPGDVLIRFGSDRISSEQSFQAAVKRYAGQTVKLELYRGGDLQTREVDLASR